MLLVLLLATQAATVSGDDLVRDAVAAARTTTMTNLVRPYVLAGGIIVETPFLRVAIQAREAMDKYLPFSETDVDRSFLRSVVTVVANDKDQSFKHLVIAIPPMGASPPPEAPRKSPKGENPWVGAALQRTRAQQERARYEASMTILQPTTIEVTEHVWQNAYSATFRTTGVRATFPLDALVAGRDIRAVLADGSAVTATITPGVLAQLR